MLSFSLYRVTLASLTLASMPLGQAFRFRAINGLGIKARDDSGLEMPLGTAPVVASGKIPTGVVSAVPPLASASGGSLGNNGTTLRKPLAYPKASQTVKEPLFGPSGVSSGSEGPGSQPVGQTSTGPTDRTGASNSTVQDQARQDASSDVAGTDNSINRSVDGNNTSAANGGKAHDDSTQAGLNMGSNAELDSSTSNGNNTSATTSELSDTGTSGAGSGSNSTSQDDSKTLGINNNSVSGESGSSPGNNCPQQQAVTKTETVTVTVTAPNSGSTGAVGLSGNSPLDNTGSDSSDINAGGNIGGGAAGGGTAASTGLMPGSTGSSSTNASGPYRYPNVRRSVII